MCGACACRGRYLQQLPSSLAASARHRKDILARCRGRLQQLPRMYTGRTSRPRRRTRSSCAVVPSRHNQRCAKPHAVRFPWRTPGGACAHPGRCMRAALHARTRGVRAPGACAHPGHARIRGMRAALACGLRHARGAGIRAPRACARRCAHPGHARGACAHPGHARAACAHPGRGARRCMRAPGALHARGALHAHPHSATTIAVGRCEHALKIMVGRFHRALQPRGVDDAPPRAVGRPHAIDPGRGRLAANLIQTSLSSVHTDIGLFVDFFFTNNIDMQKSQHATCTVDMQKYHNKQHVQYCMHVDM